MLICQSGRIYGSKMIQHTHENTHRDSKAEASRWYFQYKKRVAPFLTFDSSVSTHIHADIQFYTDFMCLLFCLGPSIFAVTVFSSSRLNLFSWLSYLSFTAALKQTNSFDTNENEEKSQKRKSNDTRELPKIKLI